MDIQTLKKDVTVAFCGYNIKHFAILAIESFLHFNPEMRANVVYFDDASSDGTKEELERRGIRVITWLPEDLKLLKDTGHENSLHIRVSLIYGSIVKRTETKYLCLIDGDASFVKNDFFLTSLQRMEEEQAICLGSRSCIYLPEDVCEEYFKNEDCAFLRKYLTKFSEDSYFKKGTEYVFHLVNGCQIEFLPGDYYAERIRPTHMFLNAHMVKKHEIYTDIFEDIIKSNDYPFANAVFDTWASWFYQIKQLGYPIIDVPLDEIRESVIHFDAIASQVKYPHSEPIWRAIAYIKKDSGVSYSCSLAGIKPEHLVLDLLTATKNKNYVETLEEEFSEPRRIEEGTPITTNHQVLK